MYGEIKEGKEKCGVLKKLNGFHTELKQKQIGNFQLGCSIYFFNCLKNGSGILSNSFFSKVSIFNRKVRKIKFLTGVIFKNINLRLFTSYMLNAYREEFKQVVQLVERLGRLSDKMTYSDLISKLDFKPTRRNFLKLALASTLSLYLSNLSYRNLSSYDGFVPSVGAHYYTFYDINADTYKYTPLKPVLGDPQHNYNYDSRDPSVIKTHLQWSNKAEIDYLIVSLWKLHEDGPSNEAFDRLFQTAKSMKSEHPQICVQFEVETMKDGAEVQDFADNIYDQYAKDELFYEYEGKPLLLLHIPALNNEQRTDKVGKLRNPGFTIRYIERTPVSYVNGVKANVWDFWSLSPFFHLKNLLSFMPYGQDVGIIPGYDDTEYLKNYPYPRPPDVRTGFSFHGHPRDIGIFTTSWMLVHAFKIPNVRIFSLNERLEQTNIDGCWNFGPGIEPLYYINNNGKFKHGIF